MATEFLGEKKQSSIVVVGSFNPAMFHPSWFSKHGIIQQEEEELILSKTSEKQTFISNQITFFELEELSFKAEINRLTFISTNNILTPLINIVTSTLKILAATVITAFGFNFSANYRIGDVKEFQKMADKVSPKKYWQAFLGDDVAGDERKGGLTSLRMKKYKDNNEGYLLFDFARSNLFQFGFLLSCNDHYQLPENGKDADSVCSFIAESFADRRALMEQMQKDLLMELSDND